MFAGEAISKVPNATFATEWLTQLCWQATAPGSFSQVHPLNMLTDRKSKVLDHSPGPDILSCRKQLMQVAAKGRGWPCAANFAPQRGCEGLGAYGGTVEPSRNFFLPFHHFTSIMTTNTIIIVIMNINTILFVDVGSSQEDAEEDLMLLATCGVLRSRLSGIGCL